MLKQNPDKKIFVVCGATSGFGRGVADNLLQSGNKILAVARDEQKLKALQQDYPGQVEYISGDLTNASVHQRILDHLEGRFFSGIFLNAGGPPAKSIEETEMGDWDQAYQSLLRWKVELTKRLIPIMIEQGYGRVLFLESSSVKQPIEHLVLSTSLRLAVVGYAKTLSEELAHHGITVNILAPGYHDTRALSRLYEKKSRDLNISMEEAKKSMENQTKVGFIGKPGHLGGLAAWLLSEEADYITGQTISVDGGVIKGVFG
ncbi:MAG: SDR family oxidoreductase [Bacteroidales bacterium]|nr:SDR family oxidoreductase [Bacteroidales bacterium]